MIWGRRRPSLGEVLLEEVRFGDAVVEYVALVAGTRPIFAGGWDESMGGGDGCSGDGDRERLHVGFGAGGGEEGYGAGGGGGDKGAGGGGGAGEDGGYV